MNRLFWTLSIVLALSAFGTPSAHAQTERSSPPDCIPQVALDAYVQRSIERKADIYASVSPEPGAMLFLGSSIIEEGPWASLFPYKPVLNWGISAETTEDLMTRLETVVNAEPAQIVLYTGGNDLSRLGRTPEQALENIERIVLKLQDSLPETDLYLTTLFPREERHSKSILELNNGLRELARSAKLNLIDGHSLFLGENGAIDPNVSNDGIHLSGAAYKTWAHLISEEIGE